MAIGYIYKITNVINGKSYIGKTIDLKRRWKQHISGNGNTCILSKAFNKYGISNFNFSTLNKIYILNKDVLNTYLSKLEIYYIKLYNTYKYGYNATIGGDGTHGYQLSPETKLKISLALKNKPISEKKREAYKRSAKKRKGVPRDKETVMRGAVKRRKPVLQYSLNGEFIREYEGVSLVPNYDQCNIIACCKGKINSAYGYIWMYKGKEYSIDFSKRTHQSNKPIIQKSKDGDIISEYKSATVASEITTISRRAINNCLTGRSKSAGGYKWIYKETIKYE